MAKTFIPYVPPEKDIAELTVKGVILGVILSAVLGAANAYLGLRVGITVSASIPAAVISMALLRLFRKRTILENNAVQTAASAGESLAAGVIFTIPALLLMEYWDNVHYVETTVLAMLGGVLGVLFTVPLRRALIIEADLTFPEGVATSEVLKAGEGGKNTGVVALVIGAIMGAVYKFMESGFGLWDATAQVAKKSGDRVFAFGSDLSPALLAVGYIIGLRIAALVFAGGVMGWVIAIPLYSWLADSTIVEVGGNMIDWGAMDASSAAGTLWSTRIRYMGVGAMLVGGVWSLIKLRKPLGQAIMRGTRAASKTQTGPTIRTEREIGAGATFLGVIGMTVPIFGLYWYVTGFVGPALTMALIMVVTGFLFSAVGAYMAGLVGSSNNPISGVTILTVLAAGGILYLLGAPSDLGPAATIMVAGVIAAAGAIGSDNMQDLKAGRILGATPKRQQIMQIIGVVSLALVIGPVLQLLHTANGFGSASLPAPQAGLMAAVADFIFNGGLPMLMIGIGAGIAVLLIIMDEAFQAAGSSMRTPPMPVAVGIYLPVGLTTPIFLGGVIAAVIGWTYARNEASGTGGHRARWWQTRRERGERNGILMASGLIAGEALVGILIAALLVSVGSELEGGGFVLPFDVGHYVGLPDAMILVGILLFVAIMAALAVIARRPASEAR